MSHPALRRCMFAMSALAWLVLVQPRTAAASGPARSPACTRSAELAELMRRVPPRLGDHASHARPKAGDPYVAAQAGIDWLVAALCTWMQGTGMNADCSDLTVKTCMGCHVQAETVLGLARSAERCYTLPLTACSAPGDESPIQFAARFIADAQRKACILGPFAAACGAYGMPIIDPTTVDGQPANLGSIGHYPSCGSNAPPASIHPIMQTTHGGLNLAGYTRHVTPTYSGNLVALANWLVTQQAPSGQWIPDRNEAPVDQGESFCTGASLLAMRSARPFATPAEAAAYDAAAAAGVAWARTAPATTTQDKAFRILTFVEGGVAPGDPDLAAIRDDLLDDQFPDGGWAERPGLQPNAYATGQALYGLVEAGVAIDSPAACAGFSWLVDHQEPDGSWSLVTDPLQPWLYTDSSRQDHFTATIWPVLALGSLRPWGAVLTVASDTLTTCKDEATFEVTITHAADTACGLFARPDTYDVSVSNDVLDDVWVDPPVIDLVSGSSVVVTVHWTRRPGLPPPGSASTTTIYVDSRGARASGCPVEATGTLIVEMPREVEPGPVGPSLRATRSGDDVSLAWAPAPGDVGWHEVVCVRCPDRAACPADPAHSVLDASSSVAESFDLVAPAAVLSGDAAPGGPGLVFYKVRARSPCHALRGPTCDGACGPGWPERCDWTCP